MSRVKTYILAPNFTLTNHPSSPWYPWLGNVIPEPLFPTSRTLDRLSLPPAGVVSVCQQENSYTATSSGSLNASMWATFIQTASATLEGHKSRDTTAKYTMSGGVETLYFEPTDEEVTARVAASSRIRAAMSSGLFGHTPVYIITGLKIARGFALEQTASTTAGAKVGGSAPVDPTGATASLGAEVGGERGRGEESAFRMGEEADVIFAYQCHIITRKGRWWQKSRGEMEADLYRPKQAFLGEEDDEGGAEMVEATAATREVLEAEDEDYRHLKVVEFSGEEDEGRIVCIVPPTVDG